MSFSFGRKARGFTLLEVLVVIAILGIFILFFFPVSRMAGGGAREAARRTQCKNNLKQIGLALHNYHDTYGSFPPAYTVDADGNRLHSWRTLILPFLECSSLYEKIDLSKPWNDPANAEVFETRFPVYQCPSAKLSENQTLYVAIVGADTCFPDAEMRSLSQISDGPSDTLLAFETDAAHAVNWMEPVDADEQQFLSFGAEPDSLHHAGGTQALLADGSVRFFSQELPQATRRALLTVAGGEQLSDF